MQLNEIFARSRKCFIPFVTAGHPDLESTRNIILALADSGCQIIEIGIPFSDPIADGPVIQASSYAALRHRYRMEDFIELVREVRRKSEVGLVFMTYLNPILQYGLERLDKNASSAGLNGILISDLTPEALPPGLNTLDKIFLVAPTSSDERIERICSETTGFIYLVARTGVTGNPTEIETCVPETIRRIRRFTDQPVAVGFGIRSAADVRAVWRHAEGAIVGSAIVRFIEENRKAADLPKRVRGYVESTFLPSRA
jgi:tryptophan synthase alpha chain